MRDIKDVNLTVDLKIIARHYVPQTSRRDNEDVNLAVDLKIIARHYVP